MTPLAVLGDAQRPASLYINQALNKPIEAGGFFEGSMRLESPAAKRALPARRFAISIVGSQTPLAVLSVFRPVEIFRTTPAVPLATGAPVTWYCAPRLQELPHLDRSIPPGPQYSWSYGWSVI